jgi:hypothetical protein
MKFIVWLRTELNDELLLRLRIDRNEELTVQLSDYASATGASQLVFA